MTWPLLLSSPHAGTEVPEEVRGHVVLSRHEQDRDGDEQAADIYHPLRERTAALHDFPIARAYVDLNRAADDFRKDGVVKTHTCWDVPVYRSPLPKGLAEALLLRYYQPWHAKLEALAKSGKYALGIDCHTMVAVAPPIAPDPGQPRPNVCLSDGEGTTCPPDIFEHVVASFQSIFGAPNVAMNAPFKGGYVTRRYGRFMPYVQLELSRGDFATVAEKALMVRAAVEIIASELRPSSSP